MKKILYTGARNGLASSVIEKFLDSQEYYLYVTVKTREELKRIKEKYKEYKNIKCLKIDITDPDDLIVLENLEIDILVNNAAIGESGSMAEISIDKLRSNFEVNVFSSVNIIQLVLKNMIKKNYGRIIIISSLAGILPIQFLGSYCATKASLIKVAETLKMELKLLKKNIDVVLVEPGIYATGFNKLMMDKKYDWMQDGYFKKELELIRKKDNLFLTLFEKNNYNSISKKIYKAITEKKPSFIYRAPYSQVIYTKLYSLFKQ